MNAETRPSTANPLPVTDPEHTKRGRPPANLWRKHVSVPGILWPAVKQRWAEFAYRGFAPFATELVCFDLRRRRDHEVTQPIATDSRGVQDAIDRQIIASYRPNSPRQFGLIDRLLNSKEEFIPDENAASAPLINAVKIHAKFPRRLRPLIEERWAELGYDSVSAYVTGLIRYDLLLSGPHKYFSGKDTDAKLLKQLDELTETTFRANERRRILLDYLIERAAGRPLTDEECRAEKLKLVQRLRVVSAVGRRAKAIT